MSNSRLPESICSSRERRRRDLRQRLLLPSHDHPVTSGARSSLLSLYGCARCHYQGSVTAGTIFHKTRTDLRKWFLAIWLLASMKKAPSAAELSRQLGVTVKTAWLVRRKIQHAMARHEGEQAIGVYLRGE